MSTLWVARCGLRQAWWPWSVASPKSFLLFCLWFCMLAGTTLLVKQAGSTVTLGTTVAISFIHADPALFLWQTCVCERGDVPFVTRTATPGQFVPGCRAAARGARSKGLSVGGAVGVAVGSMVAAAAVLAGAAVLLRRRGLLGNDTNVKAAAIAPGGCIVQACNWRQTKLHGSDKHDCMACTAIAFE